MNISLRAQTEQLSGLLESLVYRDVITLVNSARAALGTHMIVLMWEYPQMMATHEVEGEEVLW